MCCKVITIPELNKPADVWCTHCKPGKGCTIYQSRPDVCKAYTCLWLHDETIPDFMKPSESKIVLDMIENEGKRFVRAMTSYGHRRLVDAGTKQREILEQMSFTLPVLIETSSTDRIQVVNGVSIRMKEENSTWTPEEPA